jgi:hypothetical protein
MIRHQNQVEENMGNWIIERFSLVHMIEVFHNHVHVPNTSPSMPDQIAGFN